MNVTMAFLIYNRYNRSELDAPGDGVNGGIKLKNNLNEDIILTYREIAI